MARKKRKRIASRGSVNTIILKTLINGDKYGYEIIKEVEKFSDGKIILKQPSLYSSLSRFEEKGIVSSYWGDSDIGGRRHYYHLTDIGRKYYNENILKTKDEYIEDDDKPVTPIITPVSSDSIPAIANFEVKEKLEIIPDHNFNKSETTADKVIENIVEDKELDLIKALADKVKNTNRRYVNSSLKRLHFNKPKKSQKVILDTDGIFKLRDEDYQNKAATRNENIIDNVIKRSTPNHHYGYTGYTDNKKTPHTELSEEEKRRRNELFLERFNNLTKDKLKPVIEKPAEKIETKEINYRSKLNSIVENNAKYSIPTQPQTNNLFNYDYDNVEEIHFKKTNNIIEDEDDKFIDFEPTEFEVKSDNSHYAEEISNYSNDSTIKINRYEHKSKVVIEDKTYVLINKVRFIFAIILGLFLAVELAISYFVFNRYDLIVNGDKTLYVVMSILSLILVLSFMIPFFINSTQHSLNNFKLKYALTYGILLFLVSLILIYCINALAGFELDNFNYFATKLILPALLTSNFVIMPPIYYSIIKNKKLYD